MQICSQGQANSAGESLVEQLGVNGLGAMLEAGMADDSLVHVASRQYTLNCNWKVFCDNYLVRTSSPTPMLRQHCSYIKLSF